VIRAGSRVAIIATCLLGLVGRAHAQDHQDEPAWRGAKGWWAVMDRPAPDSMLYSVDMPPGWHITAHGPGAVLGDSTWSLDGPGTIEADIFLFPGESAEGYGLFLHGDGVRTGNPSWSGVLLRRDGSVSIVRHEAGTTRTVHDWTASPAITPGDPKDAVKNALRIEIAPATIRVLVNGKVVLEVPTPALGPSRGAVGIRAGSGLNLHVTKVTATAAGS
jgi:hypothetical protein